MLIASFCASDIDGMRAMTIADIKRRNWCAAWKPQNTVVQLLPAVGSIKLFAVRMVVVALLHPVIHLDIGNISAASVRVLTMLQEISLGKAGVPNVCNRVPPVRQACQAATPWLRVSSIQTQGCKSAAHNSARRGGGGGTSTRSRICLAVCLHCPYRTLSISFRRLLTSSAPAGRSCKNHGCACTCAPHPPPSLRHSCHRPKPRCPIYSEITTVRPHETIHTPDDPSKNTYNGVSSQSLEPFTHYKP